MKSGATGFMIHTGIGWGAGIEKGGVQYGAITSK